MDWKTVVGAAAPILTGLATGGPAGMAIGAISAIAKALGTEPTEQALAEAVRAGLSPEQQAALAKADNEVRLATIAAGVRERELEVEGARDVMKDVADARAHNANTVGILRLGYLINGASYVCVGGILWGCYALVSNKIAIDATTAAMMGTLIGSAMQWLLATSNQANGFFFGSSPSSRQTTTDLAKAAATTATTAAAAEERRR